METTYIIAAKEIHTVSNFSESAVKGSGGMRVRDGHGEV